VALEKIIGFLSFQRNTYLVLRREKRVFNTKVCKCTFKLKRALYNTLELS